MLLTNLGDLFKQARKAKNMTQFQVAEMADINEKYYGRIERNECYNLTIITLLQLCKVLDVNLEKIFMTIL